MNGSDSEFDRTGRCARAEKSYPLQSPPASCSLVPVQGWAIHVSGYAAYALSDVPDRPPGPPQLREPAHLGRRLATCASSSSISSSSCRDGDVGRGAGLRGIRVSAGDSVTPTLLCPPRFLRCTRTLTRPSVRWASSWNSVKLRAPGPCLRCLPAIMGAWALLSANPLTPFTPQLGQRARPQPLASMRLHASH